MSGTDIKTASIDDSFGNAMGGILHLPAGAAKSAGVVIVVSGVKDRVGPHRIYHRLAADLARRGYPVLRFDPCGIGESDGVVGNHRTSLHFSWIQKGMFDDSIARAVAWFRGETGVRDVVLAGLCGGATAAVVAGEPPGAAGYVLLAPSAVFDDVHLEAELLGSLRRGRWLGRDGAAHLSRYVRQALARKVRLLSPWGRKNRKVAEADVNFCFVDRFRTIVRGSTPVLCALVDGDPTCAEFEAHALRKVRPDGLDVYRVSGVGHEFTSVAVVEGLQERIGEWMESRF